MMKQPSVKYFSAKTVTLVSICIFLMSVLFANAAYAIQASAQTFIMNLSNSVPNLMRLVTATAYVMGFWFVFKGILELKHVGESRSMMSKEHELKTPLIYIFVGAALIYLPTSVHVGLSTFFGSPSPLSYVTDTSDPWSELIQDCFLIIQLIGTIAFIRGLVLLGSLAHHAQQGTFGKALAYLIGGIACINMYQFVQLVIDTLTLGS